MVLLTQLGLRRLEVLVIVGEECIGRTVELCGIRIICCGGTECNSEKRISYRVTVFDSAATGQGFDKAISSQLVLRTEVCTEPQRGVGKRQESGILHLDGDIEHPGQMDGRSFEMTHFEFMNRKSANDAAKPFEVVGGGEATDRLVKISSGLILVVGKQDGAPNAHCETQKIDILDGLSLPDGIISQRQRARCDRQSRTRPKQARPKHRRPGSLPLVVGPWPGPVRARTWLRFLEVEGAGFPLRSTRTHGALSWHWCSAIKCALQVADPFTKIATDEPKGAETYCKTQGRFVVIRVLQKVVERSFEIVMLEFDACQPGNLFWSRQVRRSGFRQLQKSLDVRVTSRCCFLGSSGEQLLSGILTYRFQESVAHAAI